MSIRQLMTVEQLWELPEQPGLRYELAEGELVEVVGSTALHAFIAALIYDLIRAYARPRRLGIAFPDGTSYLLARDPDVLRIPDVSFIARARIPETGIPRTYWPFAPDLAVEVVSSGDTATELRRQVREYLEAGTKLVWVVWPDDRAVTAYAAGGKPTELGADDELSGGEVLPGFGVRVSQLFEVEY